jgi:hypothetical protein
MGGGSAHFILNFYYFMVVINLFLKSKKINEEKYREHPKSISFCAVSFLRIVAG